MITYSLAHETLFNSSSGSVIVGGYSFVIPGAAAPNQLYQVQLSRPSADGDGFTLNVQIETPTNGALGAGAINAIKNVKVGVIPYLVGDVAPFRWLNAGDFGDGSLLNNDVLDTFRSAVYKLNIPLAGSDFFDAMDSSDGSFNNYYTETDAQIDSITSGDGVLDVSDVYVTFRRSLDPSLNWVERFWSNGVKHTQYVPNVFNPAVVAAPAVRVPHISTASGPRYITVGADIVQAGGSRTVQVPLRVLAADSLPVSVLAINVDLVPLDGSPAITNTITFSPAASLGSPAIAMSQIANNYAAAWLNSSNGVSGTNVIGTFTVTLPPNVTAHSSYLVHFEHFSASPNGLALFHSTVTDGLITSRRPQRLQLGRWHPGHLAADLFRHHFQPSLRRQPRCRWRRRVQLAGVRRRNQSAGSRLRAATDAAGALLQFQPPMAIRARENLSGAEFGLFVLHQLVHNGQQPPWHRPDDASLRHQPRRPSRPILPRPSAIRSLPIESPVPA